MVAPKLLLVLLSRAGVTEGGRMAYFLHLHKAGGTTVCHVARVSNGLAAPRRNCNMPGDGPRTLARGPGGYGNAAWDDGRCEERLKRSEEYEFTAVERWLDVALFNGCRTNYFFATALRRPVTRIVSHCRFEGIQPAVALSWTEVRTESPIQFGAAVVDNFYTRSFLGMEKFFGISSGNVTTEHAREAMAILEKFDAVLILERLDESLTQLYARLGWCKPPAHHTKRSWGKGDTSIVFTEKQLDALRNINQPDNSLYDFADNLAQSLEAPHRDSHPRSCGGLGGDKMRKTRRSNH